MAERGYEFYLRLLKVSLTSEQLANEWEILLAREDKICIPAGPCNVQYLYNKWWNILHGHLEIWSFVSPRGHVISSIKKSYNHIQNYYNKLAPLCVFHVNSWMPNPILHPTINTLDACIHNFPELQYVKCGWGEGGRVGSESSAREACFKSVALY